MNNPYMQYQRDQILTSSPAAVTLMLYDGMIKFGNISKEAMINKDIEKAHNNIIKIQNILKELLNTLNYKYEVAKDFEIIYTNIANLTFQANISKNPDDMEKAIEAMREIRETWVKVIKKNTLKMINKI